LLGDLSTHKSDRGELANVLSLVEELTLRKAEKFETDSDKAYFTDAINRKADLGEVKDHVLHNKAEIEN
jgi:hypothetical protein